MNRIPIFRRSAAAVSLAVLLSACDGGAGGDGEASAGGIARFDHYLPVLSQAPSMSGKTAQLYLRERADPALLGGNLEGRVLLFIHGAGTPAEVAFDPPAEGYSWMEYLAARGMDVFALDLTGYGLSTRPYEMNDRCNLSAEQQQAEFGDYCAPSHGEAATTMASDWHDIGAAVDYLRELRGVETVHLAGWSQGGPRAAGFAARQPDKVGRIVLLAPAYSRELPATQAEADMAGAAMTKQSRADFNANWDRQVGCENQYDPAVSEAVWGAMLASDPVGATWGSGLRRAPRTPTFGWTPEVVAATRTPVLMVAGLQDAQVSPEQVRLFYQDLGAAQKVYVEMACSSHNAMWERDAESLFEASAEWLLEGSFRSSTSGMFSMEGGAGEAALEAALDRAREGEAGRDAGSGR